MKVIIRCVLALVAIIACVIMIKDGGIARAQSCCAQNYCPPPPPNCPNPACDFLGGCSYAWACDSPILLDIRREGFHLTDQAHGVFFQFFGNNKRKVSWTDPNYGNAWLALDRNGNGTIDDSGELFGNDTPQPQSAKRNGFLALAVFDEPENGGNADGFITSADAVYSHLLLWTDQNHNGESEPTELKTLSEVGLTSISLDYHQDNQTDQYGNLFRYSGHDTINSVDYDRHIYDVYLVGIN